MPQVPGITNSIVEKARALAVPLACQMGYDLIDVEFVKEGPCKYLRLYIDKRGGVGIEDCERLSKEYSKALDREDFIPSAYTLEVSSPGLGRPLKTEADFRRYEGELLELRMKKGGQAAVGAAANAADIASVSANAAGGAAASSGPAGTADASAGSAVIEGYLKGFDGERVYLASPGGKEFSVAWGGVKTAKRAIRFK